MAHKEGRQQKPCADCECHWPFHNTCMFHTIISYNMLPLECLPLYIFHFFLFYSDFLGICLFFSQPRKNSLFPFLKHSLFFVTVVTDRDY